MLRIVSAFASMLIMTAVITGCSAVKDAVGGSTDGLEVEDGWTIHDDGNFEYAVILTNNTDKTLKKALIRLRGYDEEGNILNDPQLDPGWNQFGILYPGDKAAFVMFSRDQYREDGSSMWPQTPVKFDYTISGVLWGDTKEPRLTAAGSELLEDNYNSVYRVTIRNSGTEDFDWQKLKDSESETLDHIYIYEIRRDADGKIIGGSEMYFEEFEGSGSYPVIPAGGEITTVVTGSEPDPDAAGSELILTRTQ